MPLVTFDLHALSSRSATYFVEYQFPAALLDTKTVHAHQHVYEVMRITSKRMKDGSKVALYLSTYLTCPALCRGHFQSSFGVSGAAEQQGAPELVEQWPHLQSVLQASATENGIGCMCTYSRLDLSDLSICKMSPPL